MVKLAYRHDGLHPADVYLGRTPLGWSGVRHRFAFDDEVAIVSRLKRVTS